MDSTLFLSSRASAHRYALLYSLESYDKKENNSCRRLKGPGGRSPSAWSVPVVEEDEHSDIPPEWPVPVVED